ncbi:MAG: metalloprotease PmbA [Chromatiaceae bacterium]|nr:metalloprotease PmbA [Gammaproteobacteria bacterium]MCP5305172.1 metalloprotease PmbA [Chromatiaceae bacterium]MCP5315131.1 metalloprotease PmbA [Chromatiaceae bacterium]
MNQVQQIAQLEQVVEDLLREARNQGADTAEAGVSAQTGLSVTVRLGETETIEHTSDNGLGITVYFGNRKGSANTTDLRPDAIRESVAAACRIARYTSEDPAAGLADAELMARDIPDLDLYHPWELAADDAATIARDCEDAARSLDPRISNSEGATLYTQRSSFIYGNTHGFVGGYPTTRHSLSCAVIAEEGDEMQRDYWYNSDRVPGELGDPTTIGRKAAQRALARLGARHLNTRECPVLFQADVAPSLLRSLFAAIRGHAVYRKSTFLLDQVGEQIFPDWVRISEDPLQPRGPASAPFDNEGVATRHRELISAGILQGYLLDSYAARKLGLQSTASSGGVHNARIDSSGQSFEELLREMDRGVLVTELMGQGSNLVTGDYSRGASGFWVEHGEIQYPVDEITVAGNLRDMFRQLAAVGTDSDIPGSVKTGSWLIERMTVGGD